MTKKEILLTIIILAYNHEGPIAKAIESVLEQKTEYPYEIWVCEDCSTDNTLEICKKYAQEYPDKIKLFAQPVNTFNLPPEQNHVHQAFRRLDTKYFCYLDGDDYWCDENKIQIALDILENNPEYSTFAHDTLIKNHLENTEYSFVHDEYKIEIENPVVFGTEAPFLLSSSRIHRHVVDFSKKNIAVDYLIFFSALEKGPLFYYDKIMAVYNINNKGHWCSLGNKIRELNGMFAYKLSLLFDFKKDEFCTQKLKWYDNANGLGNKYYKRLILCKKIFGTKLGWKIWFVLRFIRKFGFESMDIDYVYINRRSKKKSKAEIKEHVK